MTASRTTPETLIAHTSPHMREASMTGDPARSNPRSPNRIPARIGVLRRDFSRCDGQALLEMALLSPLFVLVVLGMCFFGVGLSEYLTLANATQAGAQQLAISREETADPCQTVYTAVTNASPNLKAANLVFTIAWNGTTYVSGASGASNVSCVGSTKTYSQGADVYSFNGSEADTLTVTVTYPWTPSILGWTNKSFTLSETVQEVIQ